MDGISATRLVAGLAALVVCGLAAAVADAGECEGGGSMAGRGNSWSTMQGRPPCRPCIWWVFPTSPPIPSARPGHHAQRRAAVRDAVERERVDLLPGRLGPVGLPPGFRHLPRAAVPERPADRSADAGGVRQVEIRPAGAGPLRGRRHEPALAAFRRVELPGLVRDRLSRPGSHPRAGDPLELRSTGH